MARSTAASTPTSEAVCRRCGARWASRVEHPVLCARCKSPAWDIPRRTRFYCPASPCSYTAAGSRARTRLAKHVQNTRGRGHGPRYVIPARLAAILYDVRGEA